MLGVLIHVNLKWQDHVDHVRNKIARSTALLAKLKHYIPKYVLLIIFNSLCLSHISYALSIWGNSPPSTLKRIVTLQKKGIRHVCNAKYNSHTSALFKKCKILTVKDMFRFQCCKLMLRKKRGLINAYHASKLPIKGDSANTITRQTFDVVINAHNNLSKINSINFKVGTSWNALPYSFKSDVQYKCLSLSTFSNRIKFILLSQYEVDCTTQNCFVCKN